MAVHGAKLRWLFRARVKILKRSFIRKGSAAQIIGMVVLAIYALLFLGGAAVVTYFGYRDLPAPANSELLFIVLTTLYLISILFPLMGFNANEGLDLSKLALFPLTRAELMLSLLFSTLLDIVTWGELLILGAVVVGWAVTVQLTLFSILVMLIFFVNFVSVTQLILALLARALHSRRFKDAATVITVMFAAAIGLLCNVLSRGIFSPQFLHTLEQANYSPYLQWLPPGMAARAIQQASVGNWGLAALWLLVLAVISFVALYLWQLVVERGLTSAEEGGAQRRVRHHHAAAVPMPQAQAGQMATGRTRSWLPPQVTAIMLKDLKYMRRDPQIMTMFLAMFPSVLILIFVTAFQFGTAGRVRYDTGANPWIMTLTPNYVLFSLFTLAYNALGMERQSLTTLFLFPINPRYALWGKNLLLFVIGAIEVVVFTIVIALLKQSWSYIIPAIAFGLGGIGVLLAIGNFTSVFFPQKMRQIGRGFQTAANTSSNQGCLRGFMSLITIILTAIIMLPALFGLILPVLWGATWMWVITVPLTLIYGGAIYFITTMLVAPRILTRAPEILEVITRE